MSFNGWIVALTEGGTYVGRAEPVGRELPGWYDLNVPEVVRITVELRPSGTQIREIREVFKRQSYRLYSELVRHVDAEEGLAELIELVGGYHARQVNRTTGPWESISKVEADLDARFIDSNVHVTYEVR